MVARSITESDAGRLHVPAWAQTDLQEARRVMTGQTGDRPYLVGPSTGNQSSMSWLH